MLMEHAGAVPTVQLTTVEPTLKKELGGGVQTSAPHVPVVVGSGYATRVPQLVSIGCVPTERSPGQTMVQGGLPNITAMQAENSDVSCVALVAVAVMTLPGATGTAKVAVNGVTHSPPLF